MPSDAEDGRTPEHPEESGPCGGDADLVRGYAELLSDHAEAQRDEYLEEHPHGGGGIDARNQKMAALESFRYLIYLLIALALILGGAALVVGTGVLGSDSDEGSTSSAIEPGDEAAAGAVSDAEADGGEGALAGTWRMYMDESGASPLYDIPFSPRGDVSVLIQGVQPYTVTSRSYSVSGSNVVVNLQCQTESGDGTVIDWPEKLDMQLEGDEMHGTGAASSGSTRRRTGSCAKAGRWHPQTPTGGRSQTSRRPGHPGAALTFSTLVRP